MQDNTNHLTVFWPSSVLIVSFYLLLIGVGGLIYGVSEGTPLFGFDANYYKLAILFHPFAVAFLPLVSLFLIITRRKYSGLLAKIHLLQLIVSALLLLILYGSTLTSIDIRSCVIIIVISIFLLSLIGSKSASVFLSMTEKSSQLLSDEDMQWQHKTYKWLLSNFPVADSNRHIQLITPSRKYFPDLVENMKKNVENVFLHVKRYAGMADWPCILKSQDDELGSEDSSPIVIESGAQEPTGTFSINKNHQVIITYNPEVTNDLQALVATFSHELSHYLITTAKTSPPGGWDNNEFVTDLAAVYLGFGIFLANSNFNFQQFVDMGSNMQGWGVTKQGYLSENELVYALAMYTQLFDLDEKTPLKHLKDSLKGRYKSALKIITKSGSALSIKA